MVIFHSYVSLPEGTGYVIASIVFPFSFLELLERLLERHRFPRLDIWELKSWWSSWTARGESWRPMDGSPAVDG